MLIFHQLAFGQVCRKSQQIRGGQNLISHKLLTLFIVFLGTVGVATAQLRPPDARSHESCLLKEVNTSPESKAFEKALRKYLKHNQKQTTGIVQRQNKAENPKYVIPVVFHIYGTEWKGASGKVYPVNDDIVKQSLEAVNANFKGGNDPVDPRFAAIEGKMDIEFRLAQIDPKGNTTTGIIYHEYQEGFGLNGTRDKDIARYAWDNYKYMNVHIQLILKSGSTTNSGIAWLPNKGMNDEGTARVVYNGKYLLYSPPASSLTHEFGHFFGLHHTFRGGCTKDAGDEVNDTPATTAGKASANCGANTAIQNCFNEYINVQNHMDYNPCEAMFTQGQVTRMDGFLTIHEARKTLWTNANLLATGTKESPATRINKRVVFTYQQITDNDQDKYTSLVEHFDNDGKILNKRKIKAEGVQFAQLGILQQDVHYSVSGVPAGLIVNMKVIDTENAEIYITGKATQHNKTNSTDFTLTLLNPAITGGVGQLTHTTGTYTINFLDEYGRYYEAFSKHLEMGYSTQNRLPRNTNFESFAIGGKFSVLLRNFDGDQVTFDTYSTNMEILCNTNTKHVRLLSENATISATSTGTWQGKAGVTDQVPIITSPEYTTWRGKTAYAAFRVPTINNNYLYGWIQLIVSTDGTHVRGIAYGLREKPGATMTTTVTSPMVVYYNDRFLESTANDGSMENEISIELKNASFSKTGQLSANTHYTIKNVPTGLSFEVNVIDATHARLKMAGNSTYTGHSANKGWLYLNNIEFELLDAAFVSNNAEEVVASKYTLNMEFLGETFKIALQDKVMDRDASSPSSASFSLLSSHQSLCRTQVSYQLQEYDRGDVLGLKFISWRKDAIANSNYELTPLNHGAEIGPNSAWTKGRQYHLGRGQQMIDSDTYQSWRGQRKYIGIRFQRSGRMHYGWIEMEVSANGRVLKFLSCAVSAIPDQPIAAGTLLPGAGGAYCVAKGSNGPETITKVQLGTINNASARSATGYHDYTNLSTTLEQGNTYTLSVDIIGYKEGDKDEIYAWVDWNQDNDFEDAGETITVTKVSNLKGVATITVPANATLGNTRMRVKVSYNSTTACGDFSYGEVEDYALVVNEALPTPTHCMASGNNGPEAIARVRLGTIDNTSTRDATGYHDYTNLAATLPKNSSHTLSIDIIGYRGGVDDEIYAWIDWNQDGDFDDTGETVLVNKSSDLSGAAIVQVPVGAVLGTTVMRLKVSYGSNTTCGTFNYGEVEDYTLNIVAAEAATNVGKSAQAAFDWSFSAYPNPVKGGEFQIKINNANARTVKVKILDLLGNVVGEKAISNSNEFGKNVHINTTHYKPGIYILQVVVDGMIKTTRIEVR